ncbi:MAG TPA: PKD domain-containing protein, partial [Bacteroidia bacterium]|nr:PKD domain-containing protein [Bacteroidia bacterium]
MKTRLLLLSCCLSVVSAFTFSQKLVAQCQAGFTYTVSGGTVTFTNTSTSQSPANYIWSFGDNSTFYGTPGTHSYANPGVYYVCLSLNDTITPCTSTFCDSVHVLVGCYGITASATSTDASSQSACDGTATGSVSGGTAPYSYMWSNSTTTASMSNLCVGNYQLTVTDANGCTSSASTMVNCPFVCNDSFYYYASGLTANFINYSNDTMNSQFSWSFGDNTYSNAVNPSHAYASAGTYNVTLIMNSNFLGCSDSSTVAVTVGGPNSCSAAFSMQPDSFIVGQWYIYPSVTGQAPISYLWDFGDTTTSTQQFPTHNYTYACHHVVCLT